MKVSIFRFADIFCKLVATQFLYCAARAYGQNDQFLYLGIL